MFIYPANQGQWIWMIYSCMKIIHIHRVHVHGRFRDHGNLGANNTSDLVVCLEYFTTSVPEPSARTSSDYADTVFMSYIDRQLPLHETQRIELEGDTYNSDRLTSSTRHIKAGHRSTLRSSVFAFWHPASVYVRLSAFLRGDVKFDLCVSTYSRTMLVFENNASFSSSECSTPALSPVTWT